MSFSASLYPNKSFLTLSGLLGLGSLKLTTSFLTSDHILYKACCSVAAIAFTILAKDAYSLSKLNLEDVNNNSFTLKDSLLFKLIHLKIKESDSPSFQRIYCVLSQHTWTGKILEQINTTKLASYIETVFKTLCQPQKATSEKLPLQLMTLSTIAGFSSALMIITKILPQIGIINGTNLAYSVTSFALGIIGMDLYAMAQYLQTSKETTKTTTLYDVLKQETIIGRSLVHWKILN